MIMLFATINLETPVWLIVMMAFVYGFLTSLQYTSMNTLAYATWASTRQAGQHHCQHRAAIGSQLRYRHGLARRCAFHS